MADYISPPGTNLDAAQVIRRSYDEAENRLRVDAEVTATIGTVDVVIDAESGDNIAISDVDGNKVTTTEVGGKVALDVAIQDLTANNDSVKIGDGNGNFLAINPDGSLNISDSSSSAPILNQYNEVLSVAASVETTIATIIGQKRIQKLDVSGENKGLFTVKINGNPISKKRTWWMDFNSTFEFLSGINLTPTDTLTVTVLHTSETAANFNSTIYYY